MATLLGTDTYKKETSTDPSARANGQVTSGTVVEFTAQYTTLATEASGDVLPIFVLPVGAYFRSLEVSTDGVGGTAVIITSVGDLASAARYATGDLALTAASTNPLPMLMLGAIGVTPFAVTAGDAQTLTCTLTGTFPMTAGKLITFIGTYRMP